MIELREGRHGEVIFFEKNNHLRRRDLKLEQRAWKWRQIAKTIYDKAVSQPGATAKRFRDKSLAEIFAMVLPNRLAEKLASKDERFEKAAAGKGASNGQEAEG